MAEKAMIPAIRFKGFTDAWEQRKVGELTNVASAARVHKEEWVTQGVPFFRSSDVVSAYKGNENGRAYISWELYEQLSNLSGKLEKDDILITGGGSIGIPYIVPNNEPLYSKDADLIWIKHSDNFDSQYMFTYLTAPSFRAYLNAISHIGTIAHYTIEQVKDTPISLPSTAEQQALGSFFRNLDDLITLHQRKYEKLQNVKKSCLEKMFPKAGSNVPEIRFKGFTDAWEQRKVGQITEESSEYETLDAGLPLLTSSRGGLMYQNEYRGNQTTDSKETLFSVVPMGSCTYRHMSDDDVFHMNINTLEKGLVSREYPVFFAAEGNDLSFIVQHINSCSQFRAFCKEQKKGGTRTRLYYNAFCNFIMMVPSYEEQQRIATYFTNLDNLITLHQRELEKLQNLKKACLEKMFV